MTTEISKAQLLDEMRGFIRPERREEILEGFREERLQEKKNKRLIPLGVTSRERQKKDRLGGFK